MKDLEEQLENAALHREIRSLKQQLGLLEEDKRELELKYQNSEEKARDLKHSGKSVQWAAVSEESVNLACSESRTLAECYTEIPRSIR